MGPRIKFLFFAGLWAFLFVQSTVSNAQTADSLRKDGLRFNQYVLPVVLIAYGATLSANHNLNTINKGVRRMLYPGKEYRQVRVDDFLQYTPAVAAIGLNIAGVKGKNNLKDLSFLFLLSNAISASFICPLKKLTHEQRPDGSAYNSFPSGHSATAFANAELLYQEYKDQSVWYGIAGYACASATAYLRMQNNRHWFSDVVAGAGIGILSAKLGRALYPQLNKLTLKNSKSHPIRY